MNERTNYMHSRSLSLLRPDAAWIDGTWVREEADRLFAVVNPATGDCIAELPDLGATAVQAAIDAAGRALAGWRETPARSRADRLQAWYEQIIAHADELAELLTLEQGKPLAEARNEVAYAASYVRWFAEEATRINGDVLQSPVAGRQSLVLKEPVGVVAAITPWNFPAGMITRKVAPALAAGCTVVVKPAHETPLTALALAALAERAGIPGGVLNVVCGTEAAAMGSALCASPTVRKLSFTGSTRVGKLLLGQCADTVKKVSMELGGNAPLIVFDDADIDQAIAGVLASKFRNAGQTCICANRILVQETIADEVARRLTSAVGQMAVGSGLEAATDVGPLIHAQACTAIDGLVQASIAQGARLLCGGQRMTGAGSFYAPTVLADVTPTMPVFRREIFGPVAPLVRFGSEAEAVQLANDTRAGLAAYCYTRDLARSWRMSRALDYGMVGINEVAISSEMVPFGGVKESGLGREGSSYGIDDYLELKYVAMATVAG